MTNPLRYCPYCREDTSSALTAWGTYAYILCLECGSMHSGRCVYPELLFDEL